MAAERCAGLALGAALGEAAIPVSESDRLEAAFQNCLSSTTATGYVCLQAYLAPSAATWRSLESIREMLRNRLRLATTCGYGPRFLHSTGQLHKGGPNTGIFLQLLDQFDDALSIPQTTYSFGSLIRAQAFGDYQALKRYGRKVVRINLGSDAQRGLF